MAAKLKCDEFKNGSAAASPLRSLAIIGGGIAGLSAALRAIQIHPSARVHVFEAADRWGGVLETRRQDGFLIERSADSFLVTDQMPFAAQLASELGLEDELIEPKEANRRALLLRGDRLVPVPLGFQLMAATRIWPLLRSPALPWQASLRAALEPLVPARRSGSPESITQFISRRIGKQAFEYLAQPLVAGIYSADPDVLSAEAALRQYVNFEREFGSVSRGLRQTGAHRTAASGARYGKFRTLQNGMSTLVTALVGRLTELGVELRSGSPVARIARTESAWQVEVGQRSEHYDAVVVACSATAASTLLSPVDRKLGITLSEIPYTKVAVVSLSVARSSLPADRPDLNAFGVVVPRREGRSLIAASFSSVKFAGRAPDTHELIRVFIGGALQPELAELAAKPLSELAQTELSHLLNLNSRPTVLDVARWYDASPQYNLGHLDRLALIEQRLTQLPGLAVAGSAYNGVGIPQCIRSAQHAIDALCS